MPAIPKAKSSSNKAFISLHDFLLIGKFTSPGESNSNELRSGEEWVALYESAKNQHKMYGYNPPLHSMVSTIQSGFGGPRGMLKVISGIDKYGLDEYFILDRGEQYQENVSYLVDKRVWWAYFVVIPGQPEKKEPDSIL